MADNLYLTEEDTQNSFWFNVPEGFRWADEFGRSMGRWRKQITTVIQRVEDGALFGIDWDRGLTENCDHEYPEVSTYGTCKWRPMIAKEVTRTTYEYA